MLITLVVLLVGFILFGGSAFASGTKPTVTVLNDANHDGTFTSIENVAKNATYPWTVTYQLTIDAGDFPHKIQSISDNTTLNLTSTTHPAQSCSALVGTTLAAGASVTCYYDVSLATPGLSPLTNTVTATWDRQGGDTASSSSTVNFPALSLLKSSTTTIVTAIGQVVPYSYLVTNTGTSTVTGISLADTNVDAPPTCPQATLSPGASMTCTASHTVTAAEAGAGSVNNIGTASSNEAADVMSSLSIPVEIAAVGGTFVVGDLTVGPMSGAVGESVTFWGAQWWKLNSLSGGTGPAAFKGFEDTTAPPMCGLTWTTDPGNSTPPPATIPQYLAIIVASNVSKSGSAISGDILHVVIVKTDPGYQGNPGHAGTGTIVSVVC
ncbi:MAG TPA: hypothetical protein VKR23_01640 [Gaiellaceae bacterium]|nr:hypothetical protein [Gaiellaceae bacterium]